MPLKKTPEELERIEQKKLDNLLKKAESHNMRVTTFIRGSIKKKFVEKVTKQGYKETELCNEIFKFYFDNNTPPEAAKTRDNKY